VFADSDLNKKLSLTSANSINVARWLPQQLYYFLAYQQWQHDEPPVICVPSGNFGNICAGVIANRSGLPVKHFLAACNANDVVPEYFQTGTYTPKPSVSTISNAMDVGNPSNFIRIIELFHQEFDALKGMFSSVSITDKMTKEAIEKVYKDYEYTLDPHGAVAFYALEQYLKAASNLADAAPLKGMILETAHPVKFPDTVEASTGKKVEIPEQVQYLLSQEKLSVKMRAEFEDLKAWLMNR
jgi:threonine synthase